MNKQLILVIKIIMLNILLIVGMGLTPSIANLTKDASNSLTGVASVLMFLIPIFWVLILLGIVAIVVRWKMFEG